MKGSAKIELRDAKSGRLVKQIEKHNIVTNGALNVMKIKQAFGERIGSDGYNLVEMYFGGILLFGASIDEDVNNTIPSAAVRASYIGHASCFNTITGDSLMGTYVKGESSVGAHSAKLVFSFDTTQANGNINCICLTSGDGGVFGYGVTALNSDDESNIEGSFHTFYDDRFKYSNNSYPVVFKDDKSYNYCGAEDGIYVSDFSVAKNLGLNLSIETNSDYHDYSRAEETTNIQGAYKFIDNDNSTSWSLDTDRVVCTSRDKSTSEENRNIVEFTVVEAGETVPSTISLDYTNMVADLNQKAGVHFDYSDNLFYYFNGDWALFGDYVLKLQSIGDDSDRKCYLCINNISKGTCVINQVKEKALANLPRHSNVFANILGTIYMAYGYKEDESDKLYYRINLDTAEVADIPEFFCGSDFTHIHTTLDPDMPPIINADTHSWYLHPYLATINNVDTLEKNASRTLKITYNLEY